MTSPDSSPATDQRKSRDFYRWVGIAGLAVNFVFCGVLVVVNARTHAAVSRLQAAVNQLETGALANSAGASPHGPTAGRQERLAFLLAASADPEQARHVLEPLSPSDCVEMARALLARPAANDRNTALGALFQRIASAEPVRAIELLGDVTEAGLRNDFAAKVAVSWIEQDPAAAAAWLGGDGTRFLARVPTRRLLASAVSRWAAFDPGAATLFVAAAPPASPAEGQALRAVSREWARKDPNAALAWTRSLPPGDARKAPATYGVLEGWADAAPLQAAGYVGQLTFGASRTYAGEASAVAAHWTEQDPPAAARWALGLPDRSARRDGLKQVSATWARADAPSAARWAAGLPPSGERAEIWQGISDYWAETDPAGTESWLSTLPLGGDRDTAVGAFASRLVPTDPEKALTWAKTLSNPTTATNKSGPCWPSGRARMRRPPGTGPPPTGFPPTSPVRLARPANLRVMVSAVGRPRRGHGPSPGWNKEKSRNFHRTV